MRTRNDESKTPAHLGSGRDFRSLLPTTVAVAEFHDHAGAAPYLFPAERAHATTFAPARRFEFAMGRECARVALERLGLSRREIPVGPGREPVWPDGICGSISHASGMWAAAVARRAEVDVIGLDIDTASALPDGIAEEVVRRDERSRATPTGVSEEIWEKIVFSAKESIFKAWFPTTRRWLGFLDCRINVNDGGAWDAEILTTSPAHWPEKIMGSWGVSAGYVRTATVIEPARQSRNISR